ncbi:hypothetical protein LIER_21572 [Lithospermum erythrorhizon]|uniref:Uncharacterized protein n=1 Tax=Lithospermum erythrorhizon TaxID=34254 RepID=A0AAV3QTT2_LITER
MCTDFTNINMACPKDYYPLPNIDRLVDSRTCYKVVEFLDAFRRYHQIFMAKEDIEKIAFITEYGIYCWKMNNAWAMYQRMVNKRGFRELTKELDKVQLGQMCLRGNLGEVSWVHDKSKGVSAEPGQDSHGTGHAESKRKLIA